MWPAGTSRFAEENSLSRARRSPGAYPLLCALQGSQIIYDGFDVDVFQ